MSRFAGSSKIFGGGDTSSSDSDSSHEEEKSQADTTAQAMNKRSKYMIGSDDEEEERTIKSGATKRAEALEKVLEEVRKHANISDFNALDNDFNKMELEIKKAADEMFEEKGTKLPPRVLKVFMLVEDTINEVTAEQKKKMSKINSVSYNKLKQRFKKYLASMGEDDMTYEK
jgi:translation initiation factor 3 subunit C